MDRSSLRAIIDGANALQKECKKNLTCNTCFFYVNKKTEHCCRIRRYVEDDCENIGKYLSLQYVR